MKIFARENSITQINENSLRENSPVRDSRLTNEGVRFHSTSCIEKAGFPDSNLKRHVWIRATLFFGTSPFEKNRAISNPQFQRDKRTEKNIYKIDRCDIQDSRFTQIREWGRVFALSTS